MPSMHLNLHSKYLCVDTDVNIILPGMPGGADPKAFYASGKKYKVAWLLHGAFGGCSDWLRMTNIERYCIERDLIAVMPTGLNSGYSNIDFGMSKYSMFDFLTEELMPLVQGWLPASAKREDNFMCGLSMGGDGSLKYAVNHPDKFAGCAVLSMAPVPVYEPDGTITQRVQTKIKRLGGLDEYLASYENVWGKLEQIPVGELPRLYVACGKKDKDVYPRFLKFREYIESLGHEALFEEFPQYGHEWGLWDESIQRAFDYFGIEKTAR
ncbi:MAG: hypothetical protein IK101_08285 [Oscillospiraceae bacterium]|nr:hypothetical protein [Oscillospiraceae bacterium]